MNYLIVLLLAFFSSDLKLRLLMGFGNMKETRTFISDSTFLNLFVGACIIAPILEELVFRKFLLGYFKNLKMAMWPAIFISSLLFAMAHQSYLFQEIAVFPISIILGWIFWKSGSILPCILFHLVNNLYFCYFEFSTPWTQFDFRPDVLKNPFSSLWIVILCFIYLSKNLKSKNNLTTPTQELS
jgi:membrane protease YdiL (CAAX protease family)